MSTLQASLARPAPAAQESPTSAPVSRTGLMLCLVVSSDHCRSRQFDRVAEEQGWETILVMDPHDAAQIAARERLRLAIVDLQTATPSLQGEYRRFVERLSKKPEPLIIVCGKEDDTTGEIWSRQLGVWMYLPGVDEQSDIALVCGEARNVCEKLAGAIASPYSVT